MFRKSLAPIAAVSLLSVSACSGGSESSTTDTGETVTTYTTLPNENDTVPPKGGPPDEGLFDTQDTVTPQETPSKELTPILDSKIGNVAVCDAVYGPGTAYADIVDENPDDVEQDYSHIATITYGGQSDDASIATYSIRGLGDRKYSIVGINDQESFIDTNVDDFKTIEFGSNFLVVANQTDGSVWFSTACEVERIDPNTPPTSTEHTGYQELTDEFTA